MNNFPSQKRKWIAATATVALHLLLFLLLYFGAFARQIPQEEGGIEVMLGTIDEAQQTFTPLDQPQVEPTTTQTSQTPLPPTSSENPMITQNDESITLEKQKQQQEKKQKAREEEQQKQKIRQEQQRQQREALVREQEEERKKAEEERKANAISNSMAGAFSKSSQTQSSGTSDQNSGAQGDERGNSNQGANQGEGRGYSLTGNLFGRGVAGTLPRPAFSSNESGMIQVKVTVDPSGRVIATEFGKSTLTDRRLREEAQSAAQRARFKPMNTTENMVGYITYMFELR